MRVVRLVFLGLFGGCTIVAASGCNAGLIAVVVALVLSDDDEAPPPPPPSQLEILGVDGARTSPESAQIRVLLRNSVSAAASLSIEAGPSGGAFAPATLEDPLPGELEEPGRISGIPTSPSGRTHRIGWDAATDLGPGLRPARLRLAVPGSDPIEADVLVGNEPPAIETAAVSQDVVGEVLITVEVSDSTSDPVDLVLEYAEVPAEGTEPSFLPATMLDAATGLPSSPEGTVHRLRWASLVDMGPVDRRVVVRLSILDRIDGEVGLAGSPFETVLCVDNNGTPRVSILEDDLLAGPDSRGGIALRLRVQDVESDAVDLVVQWAAEGETMPEISGLEDAAERARVVGGSAEERLPLRIVTTRPQPVEARVERPADALTLEADQILVASLKSTAELRGMRPLGGRPVEILGSTGTTLTTVHGWDPATGVLRLSSPLDPAPAPGSRLRIELGGQEACLRLSSSPEGVEHQLVWDAGADIPGGGAVRLRATPFDGVVGSQGSEPSEDDPCPLHAGAAVDTRGARVVDGPYVDRSPTTVPLLPVDRPAGIAAGDIDGDGRLDLACSARLSDTVVALFQTAPDAFDPMRLTDQRLRGPGAVVARDLDGDGLTDLAVAGRESGNVLVMYRRNGLDLFSDRLPLAAGGALRRPDQLLADDLDRDGDIDLAVLDTGAADVPIRIFVQTGGVGWEGCGPAEGSFSACSFTDPDGDRDLVGLTAGDVLPGGRIELVAATRSGAFKVYSFEGGSPTEVTARRVAVPGARLACPAAADVDGDGILDLVACDLATRSVVFCLQSGGTFSEPVRVALGALRTPVAIASADLDGNGRVDLAIADSGESTSEFGGAVHVLLGSAGGFSTSSLERDVPAELRRPRPMAVAVGDLDRNGAPEVVSADDGTLDLAIYSAWAPGTFQAEPVPVAPGQVVPQPADLAAADLDLDGRTDLIAASRIASSIVWYRQLPSGDSAGARIPLGGALGAGCASAVGADVDGDGAPDLVTANASSGDATVLFQGPSGSWGERFRVLQSAGLAGAYSVAASDLTGDGRLDVILAGRTSHEIRWFEQDAAGAFGEARVLTGTGGAATTLRGPVRVAARDLDGDGLADILAAGELSRDVAAFYQTAERGTFAAPVAHGLGGEMTPVALATGDVDGDGLADIAVAGLGTTAAAILRQTAPRSFELTTLPGEPGANATAVALRDLDGDGRDEIALAFSAWDATILRLHALSGTALEQRTRLRVTAVVGPVGLVAADLDRDGDADLAIAGSRSRSTVVLYGGR